MQEPMVGTMVTSYDARESQLRAAGQGIHCMQEPNLLEACGQRLETDTGVGATA